MKLFHWFGLIMLVLWLSGCGAGPAALTPVSITPTAATDEHYRSLGGGEPRTIGYWLMWNSCAEGNQSATAIANGGREAGWILVDDLLQDPGILTGNLTLETCEQALRVLTAKDDQNDDQINDPVYRLAQQLTAAQLNLAAGSAYCPASDQAVQTAQFLLLGLEFTGSGSYLPPPKTSPHFEEIYKMIDQLGKYNSGTLCR